MSGPGDGNSQQQALSSMYHRWNQLRTELGDAVIQNDEFNNLGKILQQAADQRRQHFANSGGIPGNANQQMNSRMSPHLNQHMNGPGMSGDPAWSGAGMNPGMGGMGQMNSPVPQMNQMPPQMNQMNQMNQQMGNMANVGGHMSPRLGGGGPMNASHIQIPLNQQSQNMRSPMPLQMNHRMSQSGGPGSGPRGGRSGGVPGQQPGGQQQQVRGGGPMGGPGNINTNFGSGIPGNRMPMNGPSMDGPMSAGPMSAGPISAGPMSVGPMSEGGPMNSGSMGGSMGNNNGPMGNGPGSNNGLKGSNGPMEGNQQSMNSQMPGGQMNQMYGGMGPGGGPGSGPRGMTNNMGPMDRRMPGMPPGQIPGQQQQQQPQESQMPGTPGGFKNSPQMGAPGTSGPASGSAPAATRKNPPKRRQSNRQPGEEGAPPKRRTSKVQKAQQAAAQEAQKGQEQAEQHAQQAQQNQAQNDFSGMMPPNEDCKDAMNWLTLDDLGNDLDTGDLFGPGNGDMFCPDLYTNDDDPGLMEILNGIEKEADMANLGNLGGDIPGRMLGGVFSEAPRGVPGGAPGGMPGIVDHPQPQGTPSGGPPGPPGPRRATPTGGPHPNMINQTDRLSPQLIRRASVDHTGSLMQPSPVLSQHSFGGTPAAAATPVMQIHTPPAQARAIPQNRRTSKGGQTPILQEQMGLMPGNMPGNMSGNMPGNMPQRMPRNMPGGMVGNMPGGMPGGMQNRPNMAGNMANNMDIDMLRIPPRTGGPMPGGHMRTPSGPTGPGGPTERQASSRMPPPLQQQPPAGPQAAHPASLNREERRSEHLLTPEETVILSNQDIAFQALRNGQKVPDAARNMLLNPKGPTKNLPTLTQYFQQPLTQAAATAQAKRVAAAKQQMQGLPGNHPTPHQMLPQGQRPDMPMPSGSMLPNAMHGLIPGSMPPIHKAEIPAKQEPKQRKTSIKEPVALPVPDSAAISPRDSFHKVSPVTQVSTGPSTNGPIHEPNPVGTNSMASSNFSGPEGPSGASSASSFGPGGPSGASGPLSGGMPGPMPGPIPPTPAEPRGRPTAEHTPMGSHPVDSAFAVGASPVPEAIPPLRQQPPPTPNLEQSVYDRKLPAQLAQQMLSNVAPSGSASELNKQHVEQHHIDQELSLKRLKQQQWEAKQRQEEMYRQRYGTGDSDKVAFVVPGGKNLSTSSRSRRLTSTSSVASNDGNVDMSSRLGFDRVIEPYNMLPRSKQFANLEKHDEMWICPSLMPLGISGQEMKRERANRISANCTERLNELESKSGKLTIDEEIELRNLRLRRYLMAVRGDWVMHMQFFNGVGIDRSNRVHFARMKLLTQHDAALVEQFVTEQALERLKTENMDKHLYLQTVQNHREEVFRYHGRAKQRQERLAAGVLNFHREVEREERKRYERTAKQRLVLLRANDEEAYLKLIDQTKDARITHLLKQTNKFLAGLAKAVQDQQGVSDPKPDAEKKPEGEAEEVKPNDDDDDVREKIDYYEVAHRVKEQVTEQPKILVGGKLKEYQIKGLQWMVSLYNNHLNGILADEMGLGKTIQSISLITYLIEVKKVNGPFLVLVPLSTLTNWNYEFDLWAPSVNKVVYRGLPASRKALQPQIKVGNFQVLLTTYEYVIKERPLFSKIKWEHMIIDEGHRMKNVQSKLSSTLAQYYTSKYRLILTGTPLQNNLPELWALLNFVLPKIFNSVKSFEEWFNKPFAQAGSSDRMDLGEEEKLLIIRRLHKVLRPFLLRRLKKDVEQDLPDKIEKVIKCKKSALQTQLYRHLLDHNSVSLGGSQGGIRSLSNRVMQLRKLCNHPFVFEEVEKIVNPGGISNDLLWRTAGKFELLDRILPKFQRTGHRTLMFFQMTQIMDIMEDFLRLRNIKYLRLDGTTKAENRSDLLRLFNEPNSEYFCFLLSTRAGGLGLNLQTADTVIIYDTDWNPHQDLQAQDRAHRIGQTKEVRILRLITENSIEGNILERAQGKLEIDGKVIQAGKFDNKSTNEEQEAFLRTLLEAEESKTDGKDEEMEELDDEELNLTLARTEEERQLFHQMDEERVRRERENNITRLFTESELPVEYTAEHTNQQLSEAAVRDMVRVDDSGHHLRARRVSNWTDIEEGGRPSPSGSRPNSADSNQSTGVPRKRVKHESSPSPGLPTAASQASAPPVLPKPRTGRKGRPPRVAETMSPEAREQLTDVGRRIIKRMKHVADPSGRKRIDLFLELPSRSHYPDYYKVIGIPMCVATIVKRINAKYYQSFEQFGNDWRIIFRNARWYNTQGSMVCNDANELEHAFTEIYKQMIGKEPPEYVDVIGDQPEKLNLQRGLPTQGTIDQLQTSQTETNSETQPPQSQVSQVLHEPQETPTPIRHTHSEPPPQPELESAVHTLQNSEEANGPFQQQSQPDYHRVDGFQS